MALRRINIILAFLFCTVLVVTGCKQQTSAQTSSVQSIGQAYPALSSDLDEALNQSLDAFEATLADENMGGLVEFMPPRIVETMSTQNRVTKAQLIAQLDSTWAQTAALVKINQFEITRDGTKIELASSGRPYKILPTQVDMQILTTDTNAVAESETLAFLENGKWYVVRLDEPQMVAMFETAYPDLNEVEIMKPSMKIDGKLVQP